MATLHLIRHAQASMFAADYDQLSPLGEQQARSLGVALAERMQAGGRPGFDAVYTGPAKRQRDTAAWVGEAFAARGLAFPTPIVLPGADEHDGQRLVLGVLAQGAGDPALVELASRAADPRADKRQRSRDWQRIYEAVMRRWLRAEVAVEGHESWLEFHARVREAYRTLRSEARGEAALFTSVGPKAAILHELLQIPVEQAFELGWRIYNTAITRIVHSADRATLDGFNEVAHLPLGQWTHR
ncbi:histidine phosphatase family protein [Nannocystaceae bacterium ST9]